MRDFKFALLALIAWGAAFSSAAQDGGDRIGFHGSEIPEGIWSENGIDYQIIDSDAHKVMVFDLIGKGWDKWGYTEPVNIPESVMHDGVLYEVTRIAKGTFNHSVEVVLPSSISVIESDCFNSFGYDTQEKVSFNFPSELQEIESNCFNSTRLNEIKLPGSLKKIEDNCFCLNENLTSLEFGKNIRKIGADSFSGNENLKEIILPNSLALVGEGAFCDNAALEKVKLPRYLAFEYGAYQLTDMKIFNDCPNIKLIEWESEFPAAMPQSFNAVNKGECTVIVPDGCRERYLGNEYWKLFNIVEKSAYQVSVEGVAVAESDRDKEYFSLSGLKISSKECLGKGSVYILKTPKGSSRMMNY
ncbi:MAG: leucine-rich repeat domain-containing protein [Muribaculaceae bacterium]|nr:leucine-rich repeat domain-containing protein [Muribaculaceae bacterium]